MNPLSFIGKIADTVDTALDKFLPDKMSETDKETLSAKMKQFVIENGLKENGLFREFVLAYEGKAEDLPKGLLWLRSSIRPLFTVAVGYWDWLYFSSVTPWPVEKVAVLKAINLIVLIFWFGDRAIQRSGILDILKAKALRGADQCQK